MAPKLVAEVVQGGVRFTDRDPNSITLEKVIVNNRPECISSVLPPFWTTGGLKSGNPAIDMFTGLIPQSHPQVTLRTGEVAAIISQCVVVTVDLETDRGTLHWDF